MNLETRTIVINGSHSRRLDTTFSFNDLQDELATFCLDHYATITVTDIPEGKSLQVDSYVVNKCKEYEARMIVNKAEFYLFVKPTQNTIEVA